MTEKLGEMGLDTGELNGSRGGNGGSERVGISAKRGDGGRHTGDCIAI